MAAPKNGEYAVLVVDEMKIKEDLVYNKHTGKLIGYVNLGNTEQQLLQMEEQSMVDKLGTNMLAFMLRGLNMNLSYIVAHFATSKLSGEQLHPTVWAVIEKAECARLKVVAVTGDGASSNRKFSSYIWTQKEAILARVWYTKQ